MVNFYIIIKIAHNYNYNNQLRKLMVARRVMGQNREAI